MHIPAKPSSVPSNFSIAARPAPQVIQREVPATRPSRSRKRVVAPLAHDEPSTTPAEVIKVNVAQPTAPVLEPTTAPEPVIEAKPEPVGGPTPETVVEVAANTTDQEPLDLLEAAAQEVEPKKSLPEPTPEEEPKLAAKSDLEALEPEQPIKDHYADHIDQIEEPEQVEVSRRQALQSLAAAPYQPPRQAEHHHYDPSTEPAETSAHHALLPGSPIGPDHMLPAAQATSFKRTSRGPRKAKVAFAALAVAALGGGGSFVYAHAQDNSGGLPGSVVNKVTAFTPYYMGKNSKTKYTVVKDSANYNGSVLAFNLLRPDGKKVLITEVKTPQGYDTSSLTANQEFDTTYGHAFVTSSDARTTGALFTKDNTWILANAPTPISGDEMQDLISSFGPIK